MFTDTGIFERHCHVRVLEKLDWLRQISGGSPEGSMKICEKVDGIFIDLQQGREEGEKSMRFTCRSEIMWITMWEPTCGIIISQGRVHWCGRWGWYFIIRQGSMQAHLVWNGYLNASFPNLWHLLKRKHSGKVEVSANMFKKTMSTIWTGLLISHGSMTLRWNIRGKVRAIFGGEDTEAESSRWSRIRPSMAC